MSSPQPNGSAKKPDKAPALISTPRAPPSQLSPPRGSDPTKASGESHMEDSLASAKKKTGQYIVTLKIRAPLEDKAGKGDSAASGEKNIQKRAVSPKIPPAVGEKANGSDSVAPGQKNVKSRIVTLKYKRPVDNKANGGDSAAPGDKNVTKRAIPFKLSAVEDKIGGDDSIVPVVKSVKNGATPFKMSAVENDKASAGGSAAPGRKPVKKGAITFNLSLPVEDQASGGNSAAPGDKSMRKRAVPFRMAAVEDQVSGDGSVAPGAKSICHRGLPSRVKSQGQNQARKGDQPARDSPHKTAATGMPPMGTFTRPKPVDRRRTALVLAAVSPLPKQSMVHHVRHATVASGIDRSHQAVTQAEYRSQPGAIAHAESGQHVRGAGSQTTAPSNVVVYGPEHHIPQTWASFGDSVTPANYQTISRLRFHRPGEPFIEGHRVPELHPIRFRQVEMNWSQSLVTVPLYYPFVPKEAGFQYAVKFPDIPCDIFGRTMDDIMPSFNRPASYQEALKFGWLVNETYKSLDQKFPTTVSAMNPTAMTTLRGLDPHIQGIGRGDAAGGRPMSTATGKHPAVDLIDEDGYHPRKKAKVSKGTPGHSAPVAAPSAGSLHKSAHELEKEILDDIMAVIPDA